MATSLFVQKNEHETDFIKNFALKLGTTLIDLTIKNENVSWNVDKRVTKDDKGRKGVKISNRTVPFQEVISVHLHEKKNSFDIVFIDKKPKNIWRRNCCSFQSLSEGTCEEVVSLLRNKVYKLPQRPKHLLVFVNPISGRKKGATVHKKYVLPIFKEAEINAEYVITTHKAHITEYLTDKDISKYDGVVVVGGDGTLTECATGLILNHCKTIGIDLLAQKDANIPMNPIKIGIVPAGSGQGMVMFATNSYDTETAVLHIITGLSQNINSVAAYNDNRLLTFGIMLAAVGMFGDAIRESESIRWMGPLRYAYAVGKAIIVHRSVNAEFSYIETSTKNTDTSITDDATTSVNANIWKTHSCKNFRSAGFFLFDIASSCYADAIPFDVTSDENGRMKHLKILKQFYAETKTAGDGNASGNSNNNIESESSGSEYQASSAFPDAIFVDALKINYVTHTPESMKVLSTTSKREVLNMDGDPFVLTHPEVEMRFHGNILQMYGAAEREKTKHKSGQMKNS